MQVGGALGLAVLATLVDDRAPRACASAGDSALAALNGGYHLAYLVGAGLILAGDRRRADVLQPERKAAAGEAKPRTVSPQSKKISSMLKDTKAYSGFAAPDIEPLRAFYGDTLGMNVTESGMPHPAPRGRRPADADLPEARPRARHYTILNFHVEDVDATVDDAAPTRRGVREVRGLRPGREGHRARQRPAHRLVQGPGRQHPVGAGGARATR